MKNDKGGLYLLWSVGIVICIIASIFCLIFASCSGSETGGTKKPPVQSEQPADSDAVSPSPTI